MSIPIIEEELIELFLLCRGDYSTLTFQLSGFFFWRSDPDREKLFGQERKKEREKSWMVIRVTAHGVGRPFPAINWPARVRIEWQLIFGPFFSDSFPSPGESELFMKAKSPGHGICCLRGRHVE